MRNRVGHIRLMRLNTMLIIGGLVATALFGFTACFDQRIDLPAQEEGVGQVVPPPFAAFLSADRSVLIRGDADAGHATLTVTASGTAVFEWPEALLRDVFEIDPGTPLAGAEPATTSTVKITGVKRDPGAGGKQVQVLVKVVEWLCEKCTEEPSDETWCRGNDLAADASACEGELLERTLTIEVRRPEAPLMASLTAAGGTSMQPLSTKDLKLVISAGRPFAGRGVCNVPNESVGPGLDEDTGEPTNGTLYCVSWHVTESLKPAPVDHWSERFTPGPLGVDEDEGDSVAGASYDAPSAAGTVTFRAIVTDAAGPSIQREVTVNIMSSGEDQVTLSASADHPDLCSGQTATITASTTGGTGNNTFTFELVGTSLSGESLIASGAQATYTAPTSLPVTRTIRVSVSETGGSSDQTTVIITAIATDTCNDGNVCTTDTCSYGSCSNDPVSGLCNDGNACTVGDTCSNGVCVGGMALPCDDGNPCTNDWCESASGCRHANNTSACDDGNACTSGDTCSGGTCVGGPAVNCDDGNVCTDDSCNPGSGCQYANNTLACDDGYFCTETDMCSGGVCGGSGDPCTLPDLCSEPLDACVECLVNATCDDTNVCTDDACVAGSCVITNNTVACDDGLFCTETDVCSGGVCVGSGDPCPGQMCDEAGDVCADCLMDADCDDSNICTNDACAGGICQYADNANPCDDGNACTIGDTCSGGVCVGGMALTCDDGNPCTIDFCDTGSGCQYLNNSSACDDGNACTSGDTCSGGTCVGGPAVNCDDGNVCTDDSCDAGSGCQYANNTLACDDGDACTIGDTCSGGVCVGGMALTCDDGNPCTTDVCVVGICFYTPNSMACDDGLFCTLTDMCSGGVCLGSGDTCPGQMCDETGDVCADCLVDADCDDSNICTDDACAGGVCQHTDNTSLCDDGDACTIGDACSGGVCVGGTPLNCNDGNPCTTDTCVAGICLNIPNTVGCDDGLFCNGADTCSGGTCSVHTGDPCVGGPECADTCDEVADTCNLPAGALCGDPTDDDCTDPDICDGAGTCLDNHESDGTLCDDDGNPCTTDTCVAGICLHIPNTVGCDDGLFCNGADTCSGGTCSVHTGDPCVGGPECADTCDEVADTCNLPAGALCGDPTDDDCTDPDICDGAGTCLDNHESDGTLCDDGDVCNVGETCQSGVCTGGSAVVCPDNGDFCTDDACDPAGTEGNCDVWTPTNEGGACSTCANPPCWCVAGVCEDLP